MSASAAKLSTASLRLFPGWSRQALETAESTGFVIGRLLEEGDREDLRRLTAAVGEDALRDWLVRRGPRQLSLRSYAFWATLLGTPRDDAADDPLWLL